MSCRRRVGHTPDIVGARLPEMAPSCSVTAGNRPIHIGLDGDAGRSCVKRIVRRVLCGWLNTHSGTLESYGAYSYINCDRCGELRQPMPRYYAEVRFGES